MSTKDKDGKNEEIKPLFPELNAEAGNPEMTEIESYCVNCGENGVTKLLLTKIPHYKDIVVMSFECEHCGFRNNEIQSGGKIAERGVEITLRVTTEMCLNRKVVKSDHTSVRIPKLDFEIPAGSQKGEITTVEGIIDRSISGLEQDQERRREETPEVAASIDAFLARLRNLKNVEEPFDIIFRDISGECHVENPNAPAKDKGCTVSYFKRSEEENHRLGLYNENENALLKPIRDDEFTLEDIEGEVLKFPTNCPECNSPCETNMKMTNIPHFKEIVIMATTCEACGHRTNEVKSGCGIEPQGVRIEVSIKEKEDFSRDILKSETCSMEIPEIELVAGPTTLAGRFTTVEGIMVAAKEQLASSTAFIGDSSDPKMIKKMDDFMRKMDEALEGKMHLTLILDDPAGNSYVQSLSEHGYDDRLKVSKYTRSDEQNDELGISDMKLENY